MVDMIGNSAASRDKAFVMHPMTNLAAHLDSGPTIMTRGQGIRVWDDAGNEYIEGMAGLWCTSLGFGDERLVQAAAAQMRKLPYYHQFRGMQHEVGIDLAEKLLSIAPAGMSKAFFVNSGSEANDTIVKLVWYYNNAIGRPEKKKIIARRKGYHGTTALAASLSGLPHMHTSFDLPFPNILHTDCPHWYRFGLPGESEEEFATRMADSLEAMILAEGPETVAAFVAEPVMGAGGVVPPPRTYFEKVQAILRRYDVLFVADEVICGFGRTGEMFGVDTYGIRPDFMTVAKALSSAYLPIAGVMLTEEIFSAIAERSGEIGVLGHGYTYSGHPVASAVALETLRIYEEMDLVTRVKAVAPHFQAGIRRFAYHPLVGEARGVGLLGAVEIVRDKETREPFAAKHGVGTYLQDAAQRHGLIVRAIGESLAFCPPLIITKAEIDEMFDRFAAALDETAAMVADKKLADAA